MFCTFFKCTKNSLDKIIVGTLWQILKHGGWIKVTLKYRELLFKYYCFIWGEGEIQYKKNKILELGWVKNSCSEKRQII